MGEVFSWVLFPVDLFTGLVVPTTCSLTTCLTTCMVYPYVRRIEWGSVPVCSWKTPTNHQLFVENPGDRSPRIGLQLLRYPFRQVGLRGWY